MSFSLPSVKVNRDSPHNIEQKEGSFGISELMTNGFVNKPSCHVSHALADSEKNYHHHNNKMNMSILRNIQGLHAPLRISMELKATKQVGHLPFLQSSNALYESLTGTDLEIGPEDIYNTPEFCEISRQPHAVIEKNLGIL